MSIQLRSGARVAEFNLHMYMFAVSHTVNEYQDQVTHFDVVEGIFM